MNSSELPVLSSFSTEEFYYENLADAVGHWYVQVISNVENDLDLPSFRARVRYIFRVDSIKWEPHRDCRFQGQVLDLKTNSLCLEDFTPFKAPRMPLYPLKYDSIRSPLWILRIKDISSITGYFL